MTSKVMSRLVPHRPGLRKILQKWIADLRQRRELRALDDLPDHLLRDMGLDHHTRAERNRFGRDLWN
ncbi:hypothetical protein [uncultured Roseobacter sp.]|uniref:hypothetical protein n=1 Tax=uncultured Roseobacter sp. TaxID=114847 RepID=UPI0026231706|nr:hypothetical protein [uncultured Roseobacter sp.]